MDDDTLRLILDRLDENHKDLKEVKGSIADIRSGIVGQAHCDAFRKDFNQRITKVEEVCTSYQAAKTVLISETDNAIRQAALKYDHIDTRLKVVEDDRRLIGLTWKATWGNPVGKAFISGGVLAITGIYYGRMLDLVALYGWNMVLMGTAGVTLSLICTWVASHREETKKLMRW